MGWLAGQNVGIGTTTPLTRLHIAAGDLFLGNAAGNDGFVFHARAWTGYDFLQITSRTGGTWEWGKGITFVRSSGNVGIGTTAPTERLHIEGNLRLQGAFMPGNNAGSPGQVLRSAGPGTPPTWQTVYLYGGNTQSANLTTTASTTSSTYSNFADLNLHPSASQGIHLCFGRSKAYG